MSNSTKAYKRINKSYVKEYSDTVDLLNKLNKISSNINSTLVNKMKPTILLSIKWKFDYLIKTLQSPFLIITDIQYWINTLEMLQDLKEQKWFDCDDLDKGDDIWKRTRHAFNYMWPKNTSGDNYEISKEMVTLRLEQIIPMLEGGGGVYSE